MKKKLKKPSRKQKILAILVGGGPAPGINSVIRSVTIEAINSGLKVIGIYDGFKHLMTGHVLVKELSIADVSRIHFLGGSILRASRDNPSKDPKDLDRVIKSLKKLGVNYLVTIGGDGTSYSSYSLYSKDSDISVAHVPKTIDNDIPLPSLAPTFGFHTARHYGTEIVRSLMEDAKSTSRWFFIVTMGRGAGHLALGIGKASGATITLIREEFGKDKISIKKVVDVLLGAIIKRLAMGKYNGVAVIAEGLADIIDLKDMQKYTDLERDVHGGLKFEEIPLARILMSEVERELVKLGIKMKLSPKNIGYELRCAAPIPYDCEYTQDLGFAAVHFLLDGGNGAVMSVRRAGKMEPVPFESLLDRKNNRMMTREVDIDSDSYQVARGYMIRIDKKDINNHMLIKRMATICGLSPKQFIKRFSSLF